MAFSFSSRDSSSETSSIASSGSVPGSPSLLATPYLSGVSTPATERSVSFVDVARLPSTPSCNDFILVVGGLGYIGSHTAWELMKAGQHVIIIDNLSNSNRNVYNKLKKLRDSRFKIRRSRPILDFYEADYRNSEHLRLILTKYQNHMSEQDGTMQSTIRGVIHFAAYKAVGESFKKPLQYYSNNVGGMIDFCSTLADFNIKTFVFSSSATVYGDLASKGGRLTEEQTDYRGCVGLTNPYGRTKWMCEAILNDLAVSDPSWTIIALRYFNPIGCDQSGILGEDPRDTPNNLMPVVVNAMMGKSGPLNVFGTDWDTPDGTAIRDFIHVSDLAAGHLAALNATKNDDFETGYHTFNLGTGTGYSVNNVISAMEQASGRVVPVNLAPRREGDVGMCVAEPSKSAKTLNWKTERSILDACDDLVRYLKIAPPAQKAEVPALEISLPALAIEMPMVKVEPAVAVVEIVETPSIEVEARSLAIEAPIQALVLA